MARPRTAEISDDQIIVDALNRYADSARAAAYRPHRLGPHPTELRRRADRARRLAIEYARSLPHPLS